LKSGAERHARFPDADPDEFGLSWNTIDDLVPLSPDGNWAAFEGTLSDVIDTDNLREDILIARVK
jgi:hypothetical protein